MSMLQVDRIDGLMRTYGIGPVELAESAGLSYNFIYRLRKGERADMSASSLAMLARVRELLPDLEVRLLAADPVEANRWLREAIEAVVVTRGEVVVIMRG